MFPGFDDPRAFSVGVHNEEMLLAGDVDIMTSRDERTMIRTMLGRASGKLLQRPCWLRLVFYLFLLALFIMLCSQYTSRTENGLRVVGRLRIRSKRRCWCGSGCLGYVA